MKRIYYIVEQHYHFDDNGKKVKGYEDIAIIGNWRRGFETEAEAKKALRDIKTDILTNNNDRIDPLVLTYDGETIVEMENDYVGRTYYLERLCVF